jgi:Holliday junction resolvase RusA-like endonuclease
MAFTLERGKTVTRTYPSVYPDVDKLVRSTMDGLTDAGIWRDDALVVDLTVQERYVGHNDRDVLALPGVIIRITPMETE